MRTVNLTLVGLALTCFGCGGPSHVSTVQGKVTLDGQPLPDALVTFQPKGEGSPSTGRTDADGNYTLRYSRTVEGAEQGEHVVTISTYSRGNPDGDPPVPATPEKVPAKYNVKTELTKTVEAGRNTHNFELESGGEIVDREKLEKSPGKQRVQRREDPC